MIEHQVYIEVGNSEGFPIVNSVATLIEKLGGKHKYSAFIKNIGDRRLYCINVLVDNIMLKALKVELDQMPKILNYTLGVLY